MSNSVSMADYQKSGFAEASNVDALKEQTSKIPVTDDALREQAVSQYEDTLSRLDSSYSKQIANIITSQATDEKLLREQYNNSVSSMLAQLKKRGLATPDVLPKAQTAALNKHRNEVETMRASLYGVQRELPEKHRAYLKSGYEDAIAQRVAANRATNIPQMSDALTQILELQKAGYESYLQYLLARKSGGGGSGGGRRYVGGGSTSGAQSTDYYAKLAETKNQLKNGVGNTYYNVNVGWKNSGLGRDEYDSRVRSRIPGKLSTIKLD